MKSILLDIKSLSDEEFVSEKQMQYSHAKRVLYRMTNGNTKEEELVAFAKNNLGLNLIESRSVASEVISLFKKTLSNKEEVNNRIIDINKSIEKLEAKGKKQDKFNKKKLYKLKNKLSELNFLMPKDITFGGKENLRYISYLSNMVSAEKEEDKKQDFAGKLAKTKEEYQEQRNNSLYILGESNQKGNRFFTFDLCNGIIIYKPGKGKKIKIEFSDKRKNLLSELQAMSDKKEISLSVYLSTKTISIAYDDSILEGFNIDKSKRRQECLDIKKKNLSKEQTKELISNIYKKHYNELDKKMLFGKNKNRYIAYDSNPNYIGVAIIDKNNDTGDFSFVHGSYYDLKELNANPPKEATKEERACITNKRTHGISHIWKDVFKTARYFKCAYFICEELNFNKKDSNDKPKEANRQIYNVWHRTLSEEIINSYCTKIGIKKLEINCAYSTTIGNINNSFVDCVNAAIEIGRRGAFKFTKGTFYPSISQTGLHAMRRMNSGSLRDVEALEECCNWKELHDKIQLSGLRYRKSLRDLWLDEQEKEATFFHLRSAKLRHSKIDKHVFVLNAKQTKQKESCLYLSSIV